jgi:hypothetical protein
VNVDEGVHQQTFYVHETLLRERSVYFNTALARNWKEAADREVNLYKDKADCFAIYVHLLYTGNLAVTSESLISMLSGESEIIKLCKVYVLADKLQDIKAKNRAIQGLYFSSKRNELGKPTGCRGFVATKIIYDGTLPGSMARKLLVDVYTYRGTRSSLSIFKGWPQEFLLELAINLMDKRMPSDDPTEKGDGTEYMETEKEKYGA